MNKDDYRQFSKTWLTVSKSQAGKGIDGSVIEFDFDVMSDLFLEEVQHAIIIHTRKSAWMPKPSEIIAIVLGTLPDCETLFALAGEGTSAVGRYVRSLIGSDARNLHPRQGAIRVRTKLAKIEDFYERALRADYTEKEMLMLLSAGIDLTKPVAPGCPKTRVPFRASLLARIERTHVPIAVPHLSPVRTVSELETGRQEMAAVMKTLGIKSKRKPKEVAR